MATITIGGTGGMLQGNLGSHEVNVNLDPALKFDGTNDYIDCGTDSDHDFTDHFTLACWAKNDNASTAGGDREHLIAKYEGSNSKRQYRLYLHGSTLRFGVGYNSGDSNIEITYSMTGLMNHWNHYAATFDGGVMKLYVNGVLVTNTDNSGTLTAIHSNNAIELEIGAYQSGTHTWTGQMADVRIYNAVLDGDTEIPILASKINTDSSLGAGTTNLKGYWKLNAETADGGGSGTGYVVDESGTVNQGTLTNFSGTYWDYDAFKVDIQNDLFMSDRIKVLQGRLEGLGLTSLDCEAADDTLVKFTEFNISTKYTLAGWVNHESVSGAQTYFGGNSANEYFDLQNNGDTLLFRPKSTIGAVQIDVSDAIGAALGTSKWYHIAVSRNDTAVEFYIDGVKAGATQTLAGNEAHAIDAIFAEHDTDDAYNFDGKARDFRIYDFPLTANQMASLYSGSYNVTPLHWWKLDEGHATAALNNAAGAFTDSGTGTLAHGQGLNYVDASAINGTAEVRGQTNIGTAGDGVTIKGILSAPRGNYIVMNHFYNNGKYIHNNGTFKSTVNGLFVNRFEQANKGRSTRWYNFVIDNGLVSFQNNAKWTYTTLNGAISSTTATSVPVTTAENLTAGEWLFVGSEYMRIESISGNTLTVSRGQLGSTAATHSDGADVKFFPVDRVEKLLDVDSSGSSDTAFFDPKDEEYDMLFEFGTDTDYATFENNSVVRFNGTAGCNFNMIGGVSSLYPVQFTGTDIDWGYDGSFDGTPAIGLKNIDYQTAATIGGTENSVIRLYGDCEFDALTVDAGFTLDLNGQRMECSGNFTASSGSCNVDFGAGMIFASRLNITGGTFTGETGASFIVTGSTSGDNMTLDDSTFTGDATTNWFINNGSTLCDWYKSNWYAGNLIVGTGTLRSISANDNKCNHFTIARGGTFDCQDDLISVSGDFHNGGGLFGKNCLELDGSAEYAKSATFADARNSSNNGDYTIEFWFKKSTSLSANHYFFDLYNGSNNNNRSFARVKSSNGALMWGSYNNSAGEHPNLSTTTTALHDDKWHHVAFVFYGTAGAHTGLYSKGAKAIYLDGKLDAFVEGGDGGAEWCMFNTGTNMTLTVGRDETGPDEYFGGNISDVRIFSDVRTVEEIRADMFHGDILPFTRTDASYNNDPTITLGSTPTGQRLPRAGDYVSGSGIPAGAYIASITSPTEFELSVATTGGSKSGQTLTFTTMADRGNLVASYPFTEGSGSAVDNVETTSGRDLVLYDAGGAETSGLWVPIGSGGTFTEGSGTMNFTGKNTMIRAAHNLEFYGLTVSPSGGSTWITSPQNAGYDFYIKGPFTCGGGILQPQSGSRFDFANNGSDIVYNGTSLEDTSVLTMNSSGTIYLPYKTGTTAQNYASLSIRGVAALSGDTIVNGHLDYGGSNETLNTRGFDLTLSSSISIPSGHSLIADAGTTITVGHSNGFSNCAGTLKLWGENAAVFPTPANNTLTRSTIGGTALDMGTGDFSISFWYKSNDNWDREHQILGNANFYLHLNNAGASAEKLRAYMGDAYVDTGAFNSKRLSTNWNHVVATFDRSDLLKVYINGSYEANVDISGKSAQDIMGSGNLAIGEANATSGRGWHGSLADMRFYKGILLTDGGVSVGQAATGNIATLYNSGLNPATFSSSSDGSAIYADSGNSLGATTWYKLGNTNASGARTTAPALDLTDSSSGSLTLTNTGGVKAGSIYMTKSSGSYTITDSNDPTILHWRNCKINTNSGTELYISSASTFSGTVILD